MKLALLLRVFRTILSLTVVTLALSCTSDGQTRRLKFDNGGTSSPEILVEVASTVSSRELGLMYRKTMEEKRGMLFIFEDERPRSFWMKNTILPLDMIFIDSNQHVVKVIEGAEPFSTHPRLSDKPAKYVVEVNAGKAKEWGIREGSKLVMIDSSL